MRGENARTCATSVTTQYIDIALAKAQSDEQRRRLTAMRATAAAIEQLETDLPAHLERNRERRGEPARTLSKAAKQQVDSSDEAAQRQHLLQLRYCNRAADAAEAVRAIAEYHSNDLQAWVMIFELLENAEDRAVYAQVIENKRALLRELRAFLRHAR